MLSFNSWGLTHTLSTGVLTASGSPAAIRDRAAMRRDLDHAHRAIIALLGEKAVIEQLQLHRARRQSDGAEHHQSQHQCPSASGSS